MRITNPQNSNGDKLLSVREVVNRYKIVTKQIPTVGTDAGVVTVTSSDIDNEGLNDYVVVSATVNTETGGKE